MAGTLEREKNIFIHIFYKSQTHLQALINEESKDFTPINPVARLNSNEKLELVIATIFLEVPLIVVILIDSLFKRRSTEAPAESRWEKSKLLRTMTIKFFSFIHVSVQLSSQNGRPVLKSRIYPAEKRADQKQERGEKVDEIKRWQTRKNRALKNFERRRLANLKDGGL